MYTFFWYSELKILNLNFPIRSNGQGYVKQCEPLVGFYLHGYRWRLFISGVRICWLQAFQILFFWSFLYSLIFYLTIEKNLKIFFLTSKISIKSELTMGISIAHTAVLEIHMDKAIAIFMNANIILN